MHEFKDRDRARYAVERELNRSQFVHMVIQKANYQVDETIYAGSLVTYYGEVKDRDGNPIGNNPGVPIGVMVRYGDGRRRYIQVLDARPAEAKPVPKVNL